MNAKPSHDTETPKPTEGEIRKHAYRLYEQRERRHGRDLDDWLAAEHHLTAQMKLTTAPVPAKWRWYYRTLLKVRVSLLAERSEHDLAARVPFERGGDQVDVANEKSEHDTLMTEIKHEDTKVAEIEAALERIRTGRYGICEMTGRPIGEQRLRAIPWTRLSREAAAARDAN